MLPADCSGELSPCFPRVPISAWAWWRGSLPGRSCPLRGTPGEARVDVHRQHARAASALITAGAAVCGRVYQAPDRGPLSGSRVSPAGSSRPSRSGRGSSRSKRQRNRSVRRMASKWAGISDRIRIAPQYWGGLNMGPGPSPRDYLGSGSRSDPCGYGWAAAAPGQTRTWTPR
jgi:hypothetical protein